MLDGNLSADLLILPIIALILILFWSLYRHYRVLVKAVSVAQEEACNLRLDNRSLQDDNARLAAELSASSERLQWQQRQLEQGQLTQKQYEAAKEQLAGEFERLSAKIFEDREHKFQSESKTLLRTALDPVAAQLQSFKQRVDQVYDREAAERNTLIGKIAQLQEQTLQVGDDAANLARAFRGDNKAQGNWGEVILERILEESGLQKGREYTTQQSFLDPEGKRKQPDVVVHLPERKDVVIDSKVSLVAYERYCNTDDRGEKALALKALVNSVRTHIQQLSAKDYECIESLNSLEFVFLFIPVESAYLLALQEAPELYREACDRQVVLTSSTTLLASLKTIESLWQGDRQNKNAERIAKEAGALYDQFALFLASLEDVGRGLDRTTEAYRLARRRLIEGRGNLVKRAQGLRELGAKTKKQIDSDLLEQAEAIEN